MPILRKFPLFCFLVLRPHLAALTAFSWLCTHKSLLAGSEDHMGCLGLKLGDSQVAVCKAKALPLCYRSSLNISFLFHCFILCFGAILNST